MRTRLMILIAAAVMGSAALASSPSSAQVVGVDVGPFGFGVTVGDYGPYYDGPYYGGPYYYGAPAYRYRGTHGIYGGPRSDLFNYQGPNRGAMERAR
jgi:hypothetical protein